MRIGNRLGIAAIGACLAAMSVTSGTAADAAKRVQPVPLGGSISGQSGELQFGVYVPTRFGGVLTVTTTEGKVRGVTAVQQGEVRRQAQRRGVATDEAVRHRMKGPAGDPPGATAGVRAGGDLIASIGSPRRSVFLVCVSPRDRSKQ